MLLGNWLPHNLISISPLQELGVEPWVLVCETIALETRISWDPTWKARQGAQSECCSWLWIYFLSTNWELYQVVNCQHVRMSRPAILLWKLKLFIYVASYLTFKVGLSEPTVCLTSCAKYNISYALFFWVTLGTKLNPPFCLGSWFSEASHDFTSSQMF